MIWIVSYRSVSDTGLIMQRFTNEYEARCCVEWALNEEKEDLHFYIEDCTQYGCIAS